MIRILLLATLSLTGCMFYPTLKPAYRNDTLEGAVKSWAASYHADEYAQLRLLMHPDKRAALDADKDRVLSDLKRLLVQRYGLGLPLKVNETLDGNEVTLWIHDGAEASERAAVWVHAEGQWWCWRY